LIPETRGEALAKDSIMDSEANGRLGQSQKEWLRRVDETYFSAESDEEDESLGQDSEDQDQDMEMQDADSEFHSIDDPDVVNGISTRKVKGVLEHWSAVTGVSVEKLAYTTFRKVESDVGKNKAKNMGDTERIAAIAGLSGGGW